MLLAIKFPNQEAADFVSFMSQENPGIKLTTFPHSSKTDWTNINLTVESAFEIYGIGYDFKSWQMEQIFSELDLGETKEDLN